MYTHVWPPSGFPFGRVVSPTALTGKAGKLCRIANLGVSGLRLGSDGNAHPHSDLLPVVTLRLLLVASAFGTERKS